MKDEKAKVSVLMIAKNESANICAAMDSVHGWADEIVLIDDESTDNTRELARKYTGRILSRKMDLEGKQRNFAAASARNNWVMFIDLDERMTPELKQEIDATLASGDGKTIAYWVPRKNYLGDYWLRYGGWYPAPHIKLYDRRYVQWKEVEADVVHPGVTVAEGWNKAQLKNHLIHYNFRNLEDFIAKLNRHTTLEAIKWHRQNKHISLFHGLWKSFDRFWKRYVYKKGYKDGYYGFAAAFLSGFYQFAAYSKLREIRERGYYLPKETKTPGTEIASALRASQ